MRNLTVDDLIGEKDYPKLNQHLSDGDCMLALSLASDIHEAVIDYVSALQAPNGYHVLLDLVDQVDEGTNIGWLMRPKNAFGNRPFRRQNRLSSGRHILLLS